VDYLTELANAIRGELDPAALPDDPVDDLLRSYAVLALAVGEEVTLADIHNAWTAWILPRDPSHPAIVPFHDLDRATAEQDLPFLEAVRRVAREKATRSHRYR
jgi:hypothetical protein